MPNPLAPWKVEKMSAKTNPLHWYEVTDLPKLGWLTITDIGEENFYFTLADGSEGYVKADGYEYEEGE